MKNPKPEIGRKINSFQQELGKLTQDQEILSVVRKYVIPFLKVPVQRTFPKQVAMSKTQDLLINQEIMEMLDKVAIKRVKHHFPDQFLSNFLLVKKKDRENRPCINLNTLNKFIPCKEFKMEGLHCLKYLFEEKDLLCKIDLKDAYISVPMYLESLRFAWSGNLFEFLCLCFGLGPVPRIFSKLLKVPIALLTRLNIRLVIYLNDILLMGRTY